MNKNKSILLIILLTIISINCIITKKVINKVHSLNLNGIEAFAQNSNETEVNKYTMDGYYPIDWESGSILDEYDYEETISYGYNGDFTDSNNNSNEEKYGKNNKTKLGAEISYGKNPGGYNGSISGNYGLEREKNNSNTQTNQVSNTSNCKSQTSYSITKKGHKVITMYFCKGTDGEMCQNKITES